MPDYSQMVSNDIHASNPHLIPTSPREEGGGGGKGSRNNNTCINVGSIRSRVCIDVWTSSSSEIIYSSGPSVQ